VAGRARGHAPGPASSSDALGEVTSMFENPSGGSRCQYLYRRTVNMGFFNRYFYGSPPSREGIAPKAQRPRGAALASRSRESRVRPPRSVGTAGWLRLLEASSGDGLTTLRRRGLLATPDDTAHDAHTMPTMRLSSADASRCAARGSGA
jgi:hypothetical protein